MFLETGEFVRGTIRVTNKPTNPFKAEVKYPEKRYAKYCASEREAIEFLRALYREHGKPKYHSHIKKREAKETLESEETLSSNDLLIALNNSIRRSRERA